MKKNVRKKDPKIASWPGILVSQKETNLARKLGKQGHGSSPALEPVNFQVVINRK